MKAVGIIAEYNPFHNGHQYHLKESLAQSGAEASVAVMSGDFVQRGYPACADKWKRAEMAVVGGVDLVFELPFAYAVNSADFFAKGAVRLLSGLGCVETLSFGSEEGELPRLEAAASLLADESPDFQETIRRASGQGMSYPKARASALSRFLGEEDFLKEPNNILAIEYLRQLKLLKSKIKPLTVRRKDADYHSSRLPFAAGDQEGEGLFASAQALRRGMEEKEPFDALVTFVPKEARDVLYRIYTGIQPKMNDYFLPLSVILLRGDPVETAEIFAAREGIENRLISKIRVSETTDQLIDEVLSKRYTRTHVCRLLTQLLVGLRRSDFLRIDEGRAMYAHVLAFSEKGALLLREIKKKELSSIPVLTKLSKTGICEQLPREEERMLLSYDLRASDLFALASGKRLYDASDFVKKPFLG